MLTHQFKSRSSVFFKFIWAVFFGLNFISSVFAQEINETKISHYQARFRAAQWIMPGDTFVSHALLIPIPDSVYSAGVISIKKYTSPTTKAQDLLEFSHRVYQKSNYLVKKKYMLAFEQEVLSQLGTGSFDAESLLTKNIRLTKKIQGKNIYYTFERLPQ